MITTTTSSSWVWPATKLLAAALIAAFAACAFPEPAPAAQLSAGTGTETAALATQAAKKKTVYVVTSTTGTNWGWRGTATMKYDKNGLLKKVTTKATKAGNPTATANITYSYKKGNLVGKKEKGATIFGAPYTRTTKYTLGKSGQATKAVASRKGDEGAFRETVKATYKKGRLTKTVRTVPQHTGKPEGGSAVNYPSAKETREYAYKNGRASSFKQTLVYGDDKTKGTAAIKYDKKGNCVAVGSLARKLTYDKRGNVSSRIVTGASASFKYKAVKVPAGMVEKIKAQQWAIVNGLTSDALGIDRWFN